MADYKDKIKALAERNRLATTDEERAAVAAEMNALRSEDEQAFTEALEGLIKTTAEEVQQTTVRQVLNDVYEDINWAYLAQNYFGKSRSWLYHKFSGRNNGKSDDFSDIDRERLKGALVDIANRLRMTADKL